MPFFSPRVVEPRAVRLCVLGTGLAMLAVAMPWQVWDAMSIEACGPPLLVAWSGLLLAVAACATLLVSQLPPVDARATLRRARWRAQLAVATAVAWAAPLPFGPERPPNAGAQIDWSLWYEAGAVGASVAAIGAVWWARALSRAACDRAFRRALGRARGRRAVATQPAKTATASPAAPAAELTPSR